MRINTLLLALALVSLTAPSALFAEAPSDKAMAKADSAKKAPTPSGRQNLNTLWWDDPKITKALSLTDEQREKMNAHLKAHREKMPALWKMESFHENLVQRDWKAADDESQRISKVAERALRMRGQLKVNVLSVLTEEQHKLVVDGFPRLIYKPWTRATRVGPSR